MCKREYCTVNMAYSYSAGYLLSSLRDKVEKGSTLLIPWFASNPWKTQNTDMIRLGGKVLGVSLPMGVNAGKSLPILSGSTHLIRQNPSLQQNYIVIMLYVKNLPIFFGKKKKKRVAEWNQLNQFLPRWTSTCLLL